MYNDQTPFQDLRFGRPRKPNIPKPMVIGAGLLLFTFLWWVIPPAAMYWLLLPVLGILGWVASFGWRAAIVALHNLLDQLERL